MVNLAVVWVFFATYEGDVPDVLVAVLVDRDFFVALPSGGVVRSWCGWQVLISVVGVRFVRFIVVAHCICR